LIFATPLKSGYFTAIISCSVNTVADTLFKFINIDDLQ